MYFDIYLQSGDERWHWRLNAPDGERVACGGGYYTKSECALAITRMKRTTMSTEVRIDGGCDSVPIHCNRRRTASG